MSGLGDEDRPASRDKAGYRTLARPARLTCRSCVDATWSATRPCQLASVIARRIKPKMTFGP